MWPTFYQERNTFGLLHILNECVFLLAKSMFINEACPTKNVRGQIVNGIL